jgi:hypothetical protein
VREIDVNRRDLSIRISTSSSISEMADIVVKDLVKRKSAKPKTLKTLRSTIKARLRNQCGDEALDELIEHLIKSGVLRMVDGKPQYELPS